VTTGGRPAGASWTVKTATVLAPLALGFYLVEQLAFLKGELSRGQIFGRDFINYWTGARLLLEGKAGAAFVQHDYAAALARLWGPGIGLHSFSYPPSLFPFIAWAGAAPYGLAFALWCVGGLVVLLAAAWPVSRRPDPALLIALSPAVLVCLDDGQNGLLTAGLLVGGLRLIDRRPILGGVLIGLATFKPQLGLLIPLALIAAGRWRSIAAAAASAVLLAGVSLALVGPEAWRLYATQAAPFQRFLLEHSQGTFQIMMPSPFMAGRLLGLSIGLSYGLQAIASLCSAAIVIAHFRRLRLEQRTIGPIDILLLLTCGFLASPYGFNYDMAGLCLAIVLADQADPRLDEIAAWRWCVVSLWIAPVAMVIAPLALWARGFGFAPVGPLLVAGGLVLLLAAVRQRGRLAETPLQA
jgi:hypothetical protein